ncbi:DegT/DnrJ/EryC1/StrS family aminotransferase [Bacteriovorax sp. PP10]|uniref:DegT/DnrJ/EryC1/StrS family aminotransferase n=1 Tax=Bacteriovorax antarcticus TaxID=3088717 RepID=A0ABU5VUF3_9BACT|nr:DegT/DnrJ/EryC1/StrS family aminotransferase [Bacteriovorax sp. PP10]MEA9356698.1 DegT/DnrJ/EryC1/StrS family aminotransferase [Bacteriovorax sp. PP10]
MYYSDEAEIQAISNVLRKKKLFRYQGKDVETECSLFEKEFSNYLGNGHSVLLSSGTNALVTALASLNIGPGDEVIVPAYTFFATLAAILEVGAKPIIVNVNTHLDLDLSEVKKSLTPATKAIIPVHMDGYPCDMDSIVRFCQEHNLFLIEDAAQAVGGKFKGQSLGTFGDAGCFSFNVDKVISCGEGGAIFIKNQELYQRSMMFHDTCNQFGPTMKETYTITPFVGRSMRVSEIQGAMIRVQLGRLDTIIQDLKERKNILEEELKKYNVNLVPAYDSGECGTTTRFYLSSPNDVKDTIIKLHQVGLKATSPILRPAHNVWQWLHLIPADKRNSKINFFPTIDLLSKTVNINISLEESAEEWTVKTLALAQALQLKHSNS